MQAPDAPLMHFALVRFIQVVAKTSDLIMTEISQPQTSLNNDVKQRDCGQWNWPSIYRCHTFGASRSGNINDKFPTILKRCSTTNMPAVRPPKEID